MIQDLSTENSLLKQFKNYQKKSGEVPLQNNKLIYNNVHVANKLHEMVNKKTLKKTLEKKYEKNTNIIDELLRPQKIEKNNYDLNYKMVLSQRDEKIEITNTPYKPILKDKIVTKPVHEVTEEDFIVYRPSKEDRNLQKFHEDLKNKETLNLQLNKELGVEFHLDNYSIHKKNFEYKDTFIKNLCYDKDTPDGNKRDCIEYYKRIQKEAEEGQILCDKILHSLDDSIINKNEIPVEDL